MRDASAQYQMTIGADTQTSIKSVLFLINKVFKYTAGEEYDYSY